MSEDQGERQYRRDRQKRFKDERDAGWAHQVYAAPALRVDGEGSTELVSRVRDGACVDVEKQMPSGRRRTVRGILISQRLGEFPDYIFHAAVREDNTGIIYRIASGDKVVIRLHQLGPNRAG